MFTPNPADVAYAAGLFEGEGCFTLNGVYPAAKVTMTDIEPLERLVFATGMGKVMGPYGPYRGCSKQQWTWALNGFEDVQAFAAMVWPYLSPRRQSKVTEILRAFN